MRNRPSRRARPGFSAGPGPSSHVSQVDRPVMVPLYVKELAESIGSVGPSACSGTGTELEHVQRFAAGGPPSRSISNSPISNQTALPNPRATTPQRSTSESSK